MKMKWYKKIWVYPVLFVNLCVGVLLLLCAFSPWMPAGQLPLLSLSGLAFPFVLAANLLFVIFWLFFCRRMLWFPLLFCVFSWGGIWRVFPINLTRQTPPEKNIKLLSYNILSSNITHATCNAENPIISYLDSSDADVICLQECPFGILKENEKKKQILKKYPYKSYKVSSKSDADAHYLLCLSKFPILSVEMLPFEDTPNACIRYALKHEDDTLVVYNCHLQSNSLNDDNKQTYESILRDPKKELMTEDTRTLVSKLKKAAVSRAFQADMIADYLQRESTPYVVVCGDFNDSPISYSHRVLRSHLDDAFSHSGRGLGYSYNRNKLYYRIDHILSSDALKA